ncbi:helix-turn-helix domain-containing protein [Fructilactobacillus vespulae]|uniref:helix-turn-helix domain-containing protein n=1 Tax=Fructilactobacillus vespulae TaxID=1249630 RepID=UPI0039B58CD8
MEKIINKPKYNVQSQLLLLLLDKQQPRRVKLLINLLKGKRTVATLYWSLRYDLLGFLGAGKYFRVTNLSFKELINLGLIVKTTDGNSYFLTSKGAAEKNILLKQIKEYPWQLNLQKFNLNKFKERLLLLIQVISEKDHNERKYYPINVSESEKFFVKNILRNLSNDSLLKFKSQLSLFLKKINNAKIADIVANEFVGFDNNGYTIEQISAELNLNEIVTKIYECYGFGLLAESFSQESDLNFLTFGLKNHLVSESSAKTFNYFLKVKDPVLVSQKRNLKLSTIYEHLLEIAIFLPVTKFPYQYFFDYQLINKVTESMDANIDNWDYDQLESSLKNKVPFYKFRLIEIYQTKSKDGMDK